nr:D-aminoacyl-tRNA deacylase [Hymenobacter qilianensis]
MRVVVQRVREARVVVEGRAVGEIGPGVLVLAGFAPTMMPSHLTGWRASLCSCASSPTRKAR